MREELEAILKVELQKLILEQRKELNYTQMKMADSLHMATRSFADIESGKSMCGALTTVLLLIKVQDVEGFLQYINSKFETVRQI